MHGFTDHQFRTCERSRNAAALDWSIVFGTHSWSHCFGNHIRYDIDILDQTGKEGLNFDDKHNSGDVLHFVFRIGVCLFGNQNQWDHGFGLNRIVYGGVR